jgi:hypothetical protein
MMRELLEKMNTGEEDSEPAPQCAARLALGKLRHKLWPITLRTEAIPPGPDSEPRLHRPAGGKPTLKT